MDQQTEVANLIADWLIDNAPEWHMDWGTHDASRPQIERNFHRFNPISHMVNGSKVIVDYRYPTPGIEVIELDISDPKFFEKLKKILTKCEETFNY